MIVLIEIMIKPKNSLIKQYTELFKMDKVELCFEKGALEKIADLTIERKTGARGLRSIVESVLEDVMFDSPSDNSIKKITITSDTVTSGIAVIER